MTTLTSIQHIGGLVVYPPTYTSIADYLNITPNRFSMYQDGTQTGGDVTFTVTTSMVTDGTTLYYTVHQVSGTIDANTFTTGLSGSFTINSNTGTFTLTGDYHSVDTTDNYFNVKIRTISTSGVVRLTSSTIKIINLVSWHASLTAYSNIPRSISYTISTSTSATWNSHTITANSGSNGSASAGGTGGTHSISFPSPTSLLVINTGGTNGGKGSNGQGPWTGGGGGALGGATGADGALIGYSGTGGSRYYGSTGASYNPSGDNSLRQGLINKGFATTSNWSGTFNYGQVSNTLSYPNPGYGSASGGGNDTLLASSTCRNLTFKVVYDSTGTAIGTGLDSMTTVLYASTSRPAYQIRGNPGGTWGGGGSGAALTFSQSGSNPYTVTWTTQSGGTGGAGVVVIFEWDNPSPDVTRPDRYFIKTTSGSFTFTDSTRRVAIWAIGKGGNGGSSTEGATYPYSDVTNFKQGGGGGGGGMRWMNLSVPQRPPLPSLS